MLKKYAIVGLVISFVSGLALTWVHFDAERRYQRISTCTSRSRSQHDLYFSRYSQLPNLTPEEKNELTSELAEYTKNKTAEQLLQEQQERLSADLDKLAARQIDPGPAPEILYGPGWQQKVSEYAKHQQFSEVALTGAAVFTAIGMVIFLWCVLLAIARLIIKIVSAAFRAVGRLTEHSGRPAVDSAAQSIQNKNMEPQDPPTKLPRRRRLEGRSKVLTASGWQKLDASPEDSRQSDPASQDQEYLAASSPTRQRPVARVFAEDPAGESQATCTLIAESSNEANMEDVLPLSDSGEDETTPLTTESLKTQADQLQQQIDQVRQAAQTAQQATLNPANPINNTLKELAQQITAIREYAASQQYRVEKLQDGYDWTIIRTFCLRIIRCIDNVEMRIAELAQRSIEAPYLREMHDELLFALESSGVEQFEPQINCDYRGQEKLIEALTEKVDCDDPQLSGKIAQVVRPGYHYFLNDDSVKVIRTAQVKLFA